MKKIKLVTFIGVAGVAMLLLTAASRSGGAKAWTLAGTWIGTDQSGHMSLITTAPMDPAGRRFVIVSDDFQATPGFHGMFPEAVSRTKARGEMIMTGPRSGAFTLIEFATDADQEVVYVLVVNGTVVLASPDSGMSVGATVALYDPEQDPFGEEPPAYGCFPYAYSFQRVPVVPPCQ
jgi:hypothetical protein